MYHPVIAVFSLFALSAKNIHAYATPLDYATIKTAGGGPPNATLPSVVTTHGIREIQLAQFLENLEVSFFTNGLKNITSWGVTGYRNDSVQLLSRIAAEEVHLESLTTLLKAYDIPQVAPCNYTFPVSSTKDFFQLAQLIGSAGVSATIGLSERLGFSDPLLGRLLSSILTVESRHDAIIRHVQGEVPNPTPYDTGSNAIWAYNLAHSFIVPGSCPVTLPIAVLPQLGATRPCSNSTNEPMLLDFTWDATQVTFVLEEGKKLFIGWVNQLNAPVYTELRITGRGRGSSVVPQGMNGVVFAVIATQQYDNILELGAGTLAGPVLVSLS